MAQLDERLLNVDRHGCLRIPGALWLALAFLARHVLLAAVIFATAKRSPDVVRLLGDDFNWFMLVFELPAVALMVAAANRTTDAPQLVRWIWHRGRGIVVGLALLHLLLAIWLLATSDVWNTWPELFVASCALIDLAIAHGVRRDDFFRQLFAEFPVPTPARENP